MSSSDKLSSGGENTQGNFYSTYNAPFNVGEGTANGSAATGDNGSTPSWLPWAAAGAALLLVAVVIIKR